MPLVTTAPKTLAPAAVTDTFTVSRYEVDLDRRVVTVWWAAGIPPVRSGAKEITLDQAKGLLGTGRYAALYTADKQAIYDLMVGSGQFPTGVVT